MQHVRRRRRRVKQASKWEDTDDGEFRDFSRFPCRMSLYRVPPIDDLSLEDFETFAIDRLTVLKTIETARIRWPKRGEEYEKVVRASIKTHLPLSDQADAITTFDERRKDHISHFILRLAYCKTEDLRRWLLSQECELFRYRFERQNVKEATNFLHENKLNYNPISQSLKEDLAPKLAASGFRVTEEDVKRTDYFQVPFEEATELVKGRRAYLERGNVFVPRKDLVTILVGVFRARLSSALTVASKALPSLEEDDRLLPMLSGLSQQQMGPEYGDKIPRGNVTMADLPQLAKESFPMCMRNLHQTLTEEHHLKHGGRMQFGLFLKGIGLSLEESLAYWRLEFTKTMSVDKFEKGYAYTIRHNYGKEGKRTDYTPYGCMKIITGASPSGADAHGCPFRHFDEDALRSKMLSYKVPANGIKEIIALVKNHHYQVACTRYFEVTHDVQQADMAINHPNQYFTESRKVITGEKPMDVKPELPKVEGSEDAALIAAFDDDDWDDDAMDTDL